MLFGIDILAIFAYSVIAAALLVPGETPPSHKLPHTHAPLITIEDAQPRQRVFEEPLTGDIYLIDHERK